MLSASVWDSIRCARPTTETGMTGAERSASPALRHDAKPALTVAVVRTYRRTVIGGGSFPATCATTSVARSSALTTVPCRARIAGGVSDRHGLRRLRRVLPPSSKPPRFVRTAPFGSDWRLGDQCSSAAESGSGYFRPAAPLRLYRSWAAYLRRHTGYLDSGGDDHAAHGSRCA